MEKQPYPVDFETLYTQSVPVKLKHATCRIASLEHLIQMKQKAGRAKDIKDIEELCERENINKSSK